MTVQAPAVDREGFLLHPLDWSESLALELAKEESLQLTDAHWELIRLARRFYGEFGLSPSMRPLVKYIRGELGPEKASSVYLLQLFPGRPARLLARISGLPKPDKCL